MSHNSGETYPEQTLINRQCSVALTKSTCINLAKTKKVHCKRKCHGVFECTKEKKTKRKRKEEHRKKK